MASRGMPNQLDVAKQVIKAAKLTKATASLSKPSGYEGIIEVDGKPLARVRKTKDGIKVKARGNGRITVKTVADAAKRVAAAAKKK
jgi:hypothetical protein